MLNSSLKSVGDMISNNLQDQEVSDISITFIASLLGVKGIKDCFPIFWRNVFLHTFTYH